MALGFNSFNMMNTNINCGLSNMYGSNMLGFGNILGNFGLGGSVFGMGYGFSPFMDCNGYTNYDKMAGYAVGKTIFDVALMGVNYAITNAGGSSKKDVATDLNADLDSCLEDIEEKLENLDANLDANTVKISDLDNLANVQGAVAEQEKKEDEYELKKAATTVAKEEYDAANTEVANKQKDYNAITVPAENSEDYTTKKAAKVAAQEALNAAKTAQQEANSTLKNAQTVEAEAKKALDEAKEEVKDAKNAEKVITELKELIKERDHIKREINETILDNADGSKPKHRNTGLDLDKFNLPEGSTDKITDVSKQDIAQLIYLFRNADTNEERTKYQTAILNIEDSAFLGVASNDQVKAREIIRNWSAKNSNI